jgi:hypothetical protein
MVATKTKTYEDYLQEARSVSKEQLLEMTADWRATDDWRMPANSDEPVDMKKWGEPDEDSIKYFGGM